MNTLILSNNNSLLRQCFLTVAFSFLFINCNPNKPDGSGYANSSLSSFHNNIKNIDVIDQLVIWETQANLKLYREEVSNVTIEGSKIETSKLKSEFAEDAPQSLKDFFRLKDGSIRWAFHPFNTVSLPFVNEPRDPDLSFNGLLTASRSIIFRLPQTREAFSIKMPTNFPHRLVKQNGKARMYEETKVSLPISEHVKSVDREIGSNSDLILLPDVVSIYENISENGFTVRDLRSLQNQNKFYYFPAFSMDVSGTSLMEALGIKVTPESKRKFWIETYVKPVARAKAKLLLRYGLLQETPNPQNWLIELHKKTMRPTGRIVIRDLVDVDFLQPYANRLGYNDEVNKLTVLGMPPVTESIDISTGNTMWRTFLEGDIFAYQEHQNEFIKTMIAELSLDPKICTYLGLESAIAVPDVLENYAKKIRSQKL